MSRSPSRGDAGRVHSPERRNSGEMNGNMKSEHLDDVDMERRAAAVKRSDSSRSRSRSGSRGRSPSRSPRRDIKGEEEEQRRSASPRHVNGRSGRSISRSPQRGSFKRSRSRTRSRSGPRGVVRGRSGSPDSRDSRDGRKRVRSRRSASRSRSFSRVRRDNREVESMEISDGDASFILGSGGRTKRKLSRVCGAELNITDVHGRTVLEIKGSRETRERAKLYVGYVMQQRVGPVNLNFTPNERDDLTCIMVPHECVGYVTGRKGQGLRSIEEEWCTLMFFTDLRSQRVGECEKLAIFGTERCRRGAELKVMSAVEQKLPGHFTTDVSDHVDTAEGFATDTLPIAEEDYSYALGKEGSTRKKLARSSGAILEYVGRIAFIAGTKAQRMRAREYLQWLCAQRTSYVHVVTEGRNDCTVVHVPTACVAYVTGTKGNALRRIEEQTGTFIFLDGTRGNETERLLIFGDEPSGRERAKDQVDARIHDKLSGRSRYPNDGGRYRSRSRSFGRDRFRGRYGYSGHGGRGRSRERSFSPLPYRGEGRMRFDRRDDRRERSRSRRRGDNWGNAGGRDRWGRGNAGFNGRRRSPSADVRDRRDHSRSRSFEERRRRRY